MYHLVFGGCRRLVDIIDKSKCTQVAHLLWNAGSEAGTGIWTKDDIKMAPQAFKNFDTTRKARLQGSWDPQTEDGRRLRLDDGGQPVTARMVDERMRLKFDDGEW